MTAAQPIGIFDSGYGGLTVFKEIAALLPEYDFLYLGDNARTPYGTRSFETVHHYTWDAVRWLFARGCRLVVLACNTASAKALRTIQQKDLPQAYPDLRVLGVIRPVTERIGEFSRSGHVGLFATAGTVRSQSYPIEIKKFFPDLVVHAEACPLWVPLIENNELDGAGTEFFVRRHVDKLLARDPEIDAIILGCTHYPLLSALIARFLPPGIKLISQGPIVAEALVGYLHRHTEIDGSCTKGGRREFFTTDDPEDFDRLAALFYGSAVRSKKTDL
ncbi:MAG: glutamate racemase [Candidatus Aminicenantes bacterium]|nr:glutamate racemase [Candidatus Aminicenantes bacterium]